MKLTKDDFEKVIEKEIHKWDNIDLAQSCFDLHIKARDEFAKSFAEWADKNDWFLYDSNLHIWHNKSTVDFALMQNTTTDKLLDLYTQSLKTKRNEKERLV